MSAFVPDLPARRGGSFRQVASVFLGDTGLPFAHVLTADQICRVFAKHSGLFGFSGVYSTAMILWAFLNQVLQDGKAASCQMAVARISSFCLQQGTQPPTADTGDYCRARAKLSESALRELNREVADELENGADESWLWKGHHAKLVDGFTFTMPDTAKNQKAYPQHSAPKPGIGFPIARAVTVVSLATACVMDVAMGRYAGKRTGEPALLRALIPSFHRNDLAVMDRCYCSFMMIALFLSRGTHVCARQHQQRHTDFRLGRRLGVCDHVIHWSRPDRPKWMDKATFATIPDTLELREIRFNVVEKGRRTRTVTVVTTLTDDQEYPKEDIATLYGFRWNVELDIRSIKDALNLGHLRCKSPEMVRNEFRTTLLAYNLIRSVGMTAAVLHGKQPRQISFVSTCQYVLTSWMLLTFGATGQSDLSSYCHSILELVAACEVGNRPGRLEPRVIKRRRHGYKLMQKPRNVLKAELRKHCT